MQASLTTKSSATRIADGKTVVMWLSAGLAWTVAEAPDVAGTRIAAPPKKAK